MAHVDVERFAAGQHEEYGAEDRKRDARVAEQHAKRVGRIQRGENFRRLQDLPQAEQSDRREPEDHDRPEQAPDAFGAAALDREQRDDDRECGGHDEALHRGVDDREAFDRTQHGDRGRDERVAIEESGAEDREQDQCLGGLAGGIEFLLDQRDQGEHAAFAIVVHAQDQDDVLQRDDDEEAPEDQREDAEHRVDVGRTAGGDRRLAKRVERARSDVAVHDTDCAQGGARHCTGLGHARRFLDV